MSWAHQRSRELADQFLDDAHSFRERLAGAADALRRAGLVFVDTVVELPATCRERLTAIAHGAARAGSNAVAATLDAAWAVGQAGRWVRTRRGRLLALGGAPLVLALAVLVALSARPEVDPSQGAVLAVRQDTALAAAVHPIREALATRRPAAAVAPSGARVRPVVRAPKRVATPVTVTPAPATQPARATTKPETAAPPAVVKPRRAPAPAAPARPAPVKTAPASVPHPETAVAPHEPTQPPAAEQPSPPAAAPAVPTAVADEDEDEDRGDDKKRRKGKSKSGHDDRDDDRDHDDDDDHRHEDEDDD